MLAFLEGSLIQGLPGQIEIRSPRPKKKKRKEAEGSGKVLMHLASID
jgi:hypothetical protein